MSGKKRTKSKSVRIIANRISVQILDKLGPYAESTLIMLIGAGILFILYLLKVGGAVDWINYLIAFLIVSITIFLARKSDRQHAILIEITMSYLIHGGKPLLDHLLGKIIGGKWHIEHLQPGEALFDVLEGFSNNKDFEFKRRIVEALPSFGRIDPKRTVKIVSILREDWDEKWKSDLRRRAVESLVIPVVSYKTLLIHNVKPNIIRPLLQLREGDEIYTAFAVIEVLQEWQNSEPLIVEELFKSLKSFCKAQYSPEENQAINALIGLLELSNSKDSNSNDVLNLLIAMSNDKNVNIRVACSRNVTLISEVFPEKTLDLMLDLINPDQHRYVRRPISKEQSVEFIVRSTLSKKIGEKAKNILLRLTADPDAIIRTTFFDKIELIKTANEDMAKSVCKFLIENENEEFLKERAKMFMSEFTGS